MEPETPSAQLPATPMLDVGSWKDLLQHMVDYELVAFSAPSAWALRRTLPNLRACDALKHDPPKISAEEAARESGAAGDAFAHMLQLQQPARDLPVPEALRLLGAAARHGNLPACDLLFRQRLENACPNAALSHACQQAAQTDQRAVLRWAGEGRSASDALVLATAARHGQLALLQWLLDPPASHPASSFLAVAEAAAQGGHLEVLRWARPRLTPGHAPEALVADAAAGGHLPALEWLLDQGFPSDESCCEAAAREGQLGALQLLRARGCEWDYDTTTAAAEHGRTEALRWALAQGCPHDDNLLAPNAAGAGSAETLEMLWRGGHPVNARDCYFHAAQHGHLEVFQWLASRGIPMRRSVLGYSASNGDLHVLKWAREQGHPWHKNTCIAAAAAGRLEVLQWAADSGCPIDAPDVCNYAAKNGHLECVIWAHRRGAPLPWDICILAATAGRLDLLKMGRRLGYPWLTTACAAGAAGHMSVLQWAHAQGCPLEDEMCEFAAKAGRLDVLQWARQQGCEWLGTCEAAARAGHLHVLQWARANGCPWHPAAASDFQAAANGDPARLEEFQRWHDRAGAAGPS
jgi:hypothetical protein